MARRALGSQIVIPDDGRGPPPRVAVGFTQEKLAEKAGLSSNFVGRVERGEETVTLDSLRRTAKALGVRIRDLVVHI